MIDERGRTAEGLPAAVSVVSLAPDAAPLDDEVAAVVEHVAHEVAARLDTLVDGIAAQLQAELPGYSSVPGGEPAVRTGVSRVVWMCQRVFFEGRAITAPEAAYLARLGSERAAQGVPLSALRRSLRIGIEATWAAVGQCVAELRPSHATVEALRVFGSRFRLLEHELLDAMTRGYLDRLDERERLEESLGRELVNDLLHGMALPEALRARAGVLGVDLSAPLGVLLLGVPAGDTAGLALAAARTAIASEVAGCLQGAVCNEPAAGVASVAVVVPAPGAQSWALAKEAAAAAVAATEVVVLTVEPGPLALVHARYAEAADVLELALRAVRPPAVLSPGDLAVHRLLDTAPPDAAEAVVAPVLNPLLSLAPGERLQFVELLRALFQTSHNTASTAKLLNISESGVRWRKRRLAEVTGRDLDDPHDRLRYHLALHSPCLIAIEATADSATKPTMARLFPLNPH